MRVRSNGVGCVLAALSLSFLAVPRRGRSSAIKSEARQQLENHHADLGNFFTTNEIGAWQYPVAEELCTFMIQSSKKNYVDFINGVKEGLSIDDALSQRYKAPRQRVVAAFGQWIGVKQLQ